MNLDLYQRVLHQIKTNPSSWDQSQWHNECGTTHCFAGWAEILSRQEQNSISDWQSSEAAREALGLTHLEASYLFSPFRTLADFAKYLEQHS